MKLCNTLLLGIINVFLCTTVFGCSEVAETFTPYVQNKVDEYIEIRQDVQRVLYDDSNLKISNEDVALFKKALRKIKELQSIDSAEINNMIYLDEIVINRMLKNQK